jgi:hypothetical protein
MCHLDLHYDRQGSRNANCHVTLSSSSALVHHQVEASGHDIRISDRIRGEGTHNLFAAAAAAKAERVIAQSISWELPSENRRAVIAVHERAVLQAGGVVIRYGQLYGQGTFYPTVPPQPPGIHVDDAARLTLPALRVPPGVTIVADDRATRRY